MLYAVLKSLLMPPGIILLMLLAAFWLARGVLARLFIFTALSLLALMSLPLVGTALMQPLEIHPAIGPDPSSVPPEARAIVILGAGVRKRAPEYGGDTLDDASLRRVRYGAFLHRATGLPVYVTGGSLPGEQSAVAWLMADVLEFEHGVAVAAIEPASRTTWENAAFMAPLLDQDGVTHVLLVSDAWHLPQAVEAFERAGIEVIPAPTAFAHHPGWARELSYRDWLPSANAFQVSYSAIHEHLGRVWYQIRRLTAESPDVADGSSPVATPDQG
ncbi:hypothetical protein CKO27_02915 [Thiocystis violacea]|nr:hypothetical protein [Thiocystis violacea]